MSEIFGKSEDKKDLVKGIIKRLHTGADPEKLKEEFKDVLRGLTPAEIGQIEEELIKEGMPVEEVHRFCDVHLALFRENVERSGPQVSQGHPVYILMEEHKIMLAFTDRLRNLVKKLKSLEDFNSAITQMEELGYIVNHLRESESHYSREENVLFPMLEKHGITQPPAMMWMDHDTIREIKKKLFGITEARNDFAFNDFIKSLDEAAIALSEMLASHFYKENNVLFPMALKVITEDEWLDIRKEFDELGYCCFTPQPPDVHRTVSREEGSATAEKEMVVFETGSFSLEELEAMLDTLPIDITFVDREDTVRYFNQSSDRIFVRTKAVIGRKVQQCHPQKSIDAVNKILDDFKNGGNKPAVFWINMGEKLVYIRYFPVRNKKGEYIGTLEVTQDIKDIKNIMGEKRLLDL